METVFREDCTADETVPVRVCQARTEKKRFLSRLLRIGSGLRCRLFLYFVDGLPLAQLFVLLKRLVSDLRQ